ncbi:zinc-binding alcohol dehydrogenase family protein [Bifidobacterium psychraerophilum]|jgi:zinc-binding alcohol dehydrogenase family protein|uniref:zinc-binding alcohol dehydrogenase family protein n=1 Tax=Bifidobacterium psychraerophilum TaxID=218140 RepID=UPI0023F56BEC|nr:zinc-binding alcohol dehydrogenase family protein [Bifidobacterium psychraerophilum]MCI1804749.1 zinc-binding alcohol dehydrogenase family protein [Bifidobacterium psychraerophilum]MCI2177331.1 zinc-binding alcohol dehydrogenase family protein [Bifidobacterium psychraerophilum]MCI2182217.1 zinc-binding alcohol dehydrogenase family protein [Bifidobacterium psychraerophilum]
MNNIDSHSPETMTAVVSRAGGSLDNPDALTNAVVAMPDRPKGHDLLVAVKAISVNPVDVKIRAGGNRSGKERILGWDAVGEVIATGPDVTLFKAGERVWYAGDITHPGSYAQYQLVDERIVGHAPSSLDDASAAALPLTGLTAWEALFDKLKLHEGSRGTLLVVGAAGGVGSMIIQLAKQLTQVRVIALASQEESRRWVNDLGADSVIDYHGKDAVRSIRQEAPDGVDWTFSAYSKGNIALFNAVMRPFGEIVAIDDERDLDWYSLKDKALSWHWEFMFARAKHHAPDMIRQHRILESLADLANQGVIRSTVTQHLSPIDARTLRQAHHMVESGHMIGKVTLSR